jgi:hypothetical protein
MRRRNPSSAPPVGKLDLEEGERLYREKYGDKLPPVH